MISIGLTAFFESLALIGLMVPGVILLFILASSASLASIPIYLCLLAAFVGAFVGDLISYWLGYTQQSRLWSHSFFQTRRSWLMKAESFSLRWGWLSVAIGRFIGPLRPVIPLLIGLFRANFWHFLWIDTIACLAWSLVYVLPGYLASSSLLQVTQLDTQHGIILLILLIFLWILNRIITFTRQRNKKQP